MNIIVKFYANSMTMYFDKRKLAKVGTDFKHYSFNKIDERLDYLSWYYYKYTKMNYPFFTHYPFCLVYKEVRYDG